MGSRTAIVAWLSVTTPLAAQLPTCRLEGRVVDPMQSAVVGATVTAEIDGEVLARTQTDGEGAFVLPRLPWRVLSVRATTAAPDIGAEWVDLLGLRRQFVHIVTMPARRVTGVVRDDYGHAVPRAWIVAAPTGSDRLALASSIVQADDHGAFALTHVPFGKNVLRAWAPDHDAFEGDVDGTTDVELDCRIEKDAAQERIFVLDGGTPTLRGTARLAVSVRHDAFPLPLPPEVRRPPLLDGRWTVRGWPFADAMLAWATVEGAGLAPPGYVTPAGVGSRTRSFTVLDDGATIAGRVVGPDGPRTTWLVMEPRADRGLPVRIFGQTRADGTFELPAPTEVDEEFRLRVLAPDLVVDRAGPDERTWRATKHTVGAKLTVGVHGAHQIRLRAVTAEGTPIAGATASIFADATTGPRAAWGRGMQASVGNGTTGLDGTLEITGLDLDARDELTCRVQSLAGWANRRFVVGDSLDIDLGTVAVEPGVALLVNCTDADRRPAPGARVVLSLWSNVHYLETVRAADRTGSLRLTGHFAQGCSAQWVGNEANDVTVQPVPGLEQTIELRRVK